MELKRRALIPWVILISVLLLGSFAAYLWTLDRQMVYAFTHEAEFVPTRIYSDVAKIAPPQLRGQVEARLKDLAYEYQTTDTTLQFTLHGGEYPSYLIPSNDPTFDAYHQPITLHFSGPEQDAVLQSIQVAGMEVPDIYLEPELVATLSRSSQTEIRDPLKFDQIPANVWKAIIAIEDQHFMEHNGLDPRGIARAMWTDLKTFSFAQGGSTITQQLVKNLMARHSKNVIRKINELFLALLLEARYDKKQILERYLNEVYLGQIGNLEVHGVAEGAEHFFGKDLQQLNLAEMALMAGLIRGPGYYSPYRHPDRAIERQKLVLRKMVETGQIAQEEMDQALKLPIRLVPPRKVASRAPYFTDYVKAQLIEKLKDRLSEEEIPAAGYRVYTSLDVLTNEAAQRAVANGVDSLEKRLKLEGTDRLEGALAAVDQSTGYIRALVGGRNYAQSNFNRILNMKRQVGSTFKPFVYLTALNSKDSRGIPYTPGYPIEDAPWTLVFDSGRQQWAPRNYEREFRGWITLRTALAHSINTVAAKLGVQVGIDNVIATARALGIESDLPKVPALSLGVAELSPVELLKAYATIANHGQSDDLTVIRAITLDDYHTFIAHFVHNPRQVFPAGPVDLLADMMKNVFTEGTARGAALMGFERPAAGKTGTTSHHRDAWFAGFTPQLTTVVWVGRDLDRDSEKSRVKLTGAGAALPIWVDFMKQALAGEPPTPFPLSPYLTQIRLDSKTGQRASSDCPEGRIVIDDAVLGQEPTGWSCENLWPPSVPTTSM